jgi:hypothetical protein
MEINDITGVTVRAAMKVLNFNVPHLRQGIKRMAN